MRGVRPVGGSRRRGHAPRGRGAVLSTRLHWGGLAWLALRRDGLRRRRSHPKPTALLNVAHELRELVKIELAIGMGVVGAQNVHGRSHVRVDPVVLQRRAQLAIVEVPRPVGVKVTEGGGDARWNVAGPFRPCVGRGGVVGLPEVHPIPCAAVPQRTALVTGRVGIGVGIGVGIVAARPLGAFAFPHLPARRHAS